MHVSVFEVSKSEALAVDVSILLLESLKLARSLELLLLDSDTLHDSLINEQYTRKY